MAGFNSNWSLAPDIAGRPVHQSPELGFGASHTPSMNQGFNPSNFSLPVAQNHLWPSLDPFGAAPLFNSTGYPSTATFTGLGQQKQAAGNNQSTVPSYGARVAGGRWVSETLDNPEAHLTDTLGNVPLFSSLRPIERQSESNLLKSIGKHSLSQKCQQAPQMRLIRSMTGRISRAFSTLPLHELFLTVFQYTRLDCPYKATSASGEQRHYTPSGGTHRSRHNLRATPKASTCRVQWDQGSRNCLCEE